MSPSLVVSGSSGTESASSCTLRQCVNDCAGSFVPLHIAARACQRAASRPSPAASQCCARSAERSSSRSGLCWTVARATAACTAARRSASCDLYATSWVSGCLNA